MWKVQIDVKVKVLEPNEGWNREIFIEMLASQTGLILESSTSLAHQTLQRICFLFHISLGPSTLTLTVRRPRASFIVFLVLERKKRIFGFQTVGLCWLWVF